MKRDYAKVGMSHKSVSKRAKYARPVKQTVAQTVQREILKTAEIKEVQSAAVNSSSTTTGTVVLLNSIAEGDDANQRNGRKITTRAIDVMYRYLCSSTNPGGSAQVCIVYDAQPDGTTATYSQIFDTSATAAGISFKNTLQFKERFKIFQFDQLPESNGSDATNGFTHRTRHYIRLSGALLEKYGKTRYNATTAACPNTGAWYLTYGDSTNVGATAQISYNVKYQYTDA